MHQLEIIRSRICLSSKIHRISEHSVFQDGRFLITSVRAHTYGEIFKTDIFSDKLCV